MRISCEKTDPAYRYGVAHQCKVRFNGVEINFVVTADEEKRYIKRMCLNQWGNPILNADKSDYLTEEVYGDVYIDVPDHLKAFV